MMLSDQLNHLFSHGSTTQSWCSSCHNMGTGCCWCRPRAAAHIPAAPPLTCTPSHGRKSLPCARAVLQLCMPHDQASRVVQPCSAPCLAGERASARDPLPGAVTSALGFCQRMRSPPAPFTKSWMAAPGPPSCPHCTGHQGAAASALTALRPACRWRRRLCRRGPDARPRQRQLDDHARLEVSCERLRELLGACATRKCATRLSRSMDTVVQASTWRSSGACMPIWCKHAYLYWICIEPAAAQRAGGQAWGLCISRSLNTTRPRRRAARAHRSSAAAGGWRCAAPSRSCACW
jgi:hypothetical protein